MMQTIRRREWYAGDNVTYTYYTLTMWHRAWHFSYVRPKRKSDIMFHRIRGSA